MKKIRYVILACFIVVPAMINLNNIIAQPGGDPPPNPPCWPPPCTIPIDGGIGFLIVAGIAYGGKKVLDQKKNSI